MKVILGCDQCDKYIESSRAIQRLVKLADEIIVPITRKPAPRAKDTIPLPEEQEYIPARCQTRNKFPS